MDYFVDCDVDCSRVMKKMMIVVWMMTMTMTMMMMTVGVKFPDSPSIASSSLSGANFVPGNSVDICPVSKCEVRTCAT